MAFSSSDSLLSLLSTLVKNTQNSEPLQQSLQYHKFSFNDYTIINLQKEMVRAQCLSTKGNKSYFVINFCSKKLFSTSTPKKKVGARKTPNGNELRLSSDEKCFLCVPTSQNQITKKVLTVIFREKMFFLPVEICMNCKVFL